MSDEKDVTNREVTEKTEKDIEFLSKSNSKNKRNKKKVKKKVLKKIKPLPLPGSPLVISRENHILSRKLIDPDALKIMYRLLKYGYSAFLVGGGVRDILLSKTPKDFDIGTSARPNEIRKLFRNSRIIGKRFKLVHIYFKNQKTIEVSTFRKKGHGDTEDVSSINTLASDNEYGDAKTDALRRDLTINGLFYDLSSFSIIDYVGGMKDIKNKIVRIIGNPEVRIIEDPVRMIRAVRHASKANFKIHKDTYDAISLNAKSITLCPKARVNEEILRELRYGHTKKSFKLFKKIGLLKYLVPMLDEILETGDEEDKKAVYFTLSKFDTAYLSKIEYLPSIIYASIFIGVGANRFLSKSSSKVVKESREYAWSAVPFKDYETLENGVTHYLLAVKRGALKNDIDTWFRPLGVSRKEREYMEKLLIARLLMFGEYYGQGKAVHINKKHYFSDALSLLELTARSSEALGCFKYWKQKEYKRFGKLKKGRRLKIRNKKFRGNFRQFRKYSNKKAKGE